MRSGSCGGEREAQPAAQLAEQLARCLGVTRQFSFVVACATTLQVAVQLAAGNSDRFATALVAFDRSNSNVLHRCPGECISKRCEAGCYESEVQRYHVWQYQDHFAKLRRTGRSGSSGNKGTSLSKDLILRDAAGSYSVCLSVRSVVVVVVVVVVDSPSSFLKLETV